jgi:hypothetical protein
MPTLDTEVNGSLQTKIKITRLIYTKQHGKTLIPSIRKNWKMNSILSSKSGRSRTQLGSRKMAKLKRRQERVSKRVIRSQRKKKAPAKKPRQNKKKKERMKRVMLPREKVRRNKNRKNDHDQAIHSKISHNFQSLSMNSQPNNAIKFIS